MADLIADRICKSFNELIVLKDFSYSFPAGSVTCITGPSGCGKTTLLHILMGLLKPDLGSITGIPAESRLAAVFQEDRLCENLSAILNVWLVRSRDTAGYQESTGEALQSDAVILREAEKLLLKTGLDSEALHKPVRELSGGMRRRVAIARALIVKPDILFLDEPFAGLDDAVKESTAGLIRENTENRTVILVSHNDDEVRLLNAETLILKKI